MNILFDVDGVLIDGWHADPARRRPWDATIEADLGIDRDAFRRLFFDGPDSPMANCLVGRRDLRDALAAILPRAGYRGRAADVMRYWFQKDAAIDADTLRAAADIRGRSGARVYLATNQEHHRAGHLWHDLGFSARFDGIFYSAAIGHTKADGRFFQAVGRALGPGRPLFFDDHAGAVAAARDAGWDAAVFASVRDVLDHPRLRHL